MNSRRFIFKKDVIILLCILAVAGVLYAVFIGGGDRSRQAEIVYENKVVKTVLLDKDDSFTVPQAPNVVFEIKDGRIRFESSDCPDKICVGMGWLNKAGQTAVCLPNRISIRIVANEGEAVPDTAI